MVILEKNRENKSLIVIGGGITGLSTALTWALNHDVKKEHVLLIEKEPKTGGYVTSYERDGFLFDTCQMIPNLSDILNYLGIKIDLKAFTGYYMRIFLVNPKTQERKVLELPSGVEFFKKELMRRYPNNAEQIEKFLDYSRAMYLELFDLKVEPTIGEIFKTLIKCPKIVKNGSKTFKSYFEKFGITEPEVIEIFNVFAEFSALPAEQVTSIVPISAMNSLLDGVFRPTKGFIELPKQLEKRYLSLGGELRVNTKVKNIIIEKGTVKGVKLENNEELEANYVVSTIDPKVAMRDMVGLDLIRQLDKKYADKVEEVKMSCSSINLSIGLDDEVDLAALGMDCGYNVITTGEDTYDRLFEYYERGEIGFSDTRFHLGVVCPSLTTGGKPNITVRITPVALADWQELRGKNPEEYKKRKEEWADFFIDKVEKYLIPNLREHLRVLDISTPATYARYSGSPTGAIYDMAPYTNNFGRTRLKMRTPIKGLFQPKFVHGVFGCLLAGLQVNDMILNRKIMDGNARYRA